MMTKNSDIDILPINKLWSPGSKEALAVTLSHLLKQEPLVQHRAERSLVGTVVARATGESDIRTGLRKAYEQYNTRELGSFVIYAANNEFKGLAIIDPSPYLRRHKFSLPTPAVSSKLVTQVQVPGPRVYAWMKPKDTESVDDYLSSTYRQLADPDGLASDFYETYAETQPTLSEDGRPVAFTIEPMSSPDWIHKTIRTAGFVEVDRKYYDDREGRMTVPTMSRYSIAPQA